MSDTLQSHILAEAASDISESVRAVTACDVSITLLVGESGETMELAGWSGDDDWYPDEAEVTEPVRSDSPAARACHRKSTLVFGHGGNPSDGLPTWAREVGLTSGIVIPAIKSGSAIGAVYALNFKRRAVSFGEINQAELAVTLGARSLPVMARAGTGDASDIFSAQGVQPGVVRDLAPLEFEEAVIDPLREQVVINGVNVALSRTEFIMLYILGHNRGEVVPHHVLLEACWQDDFPALSAVDATVYRLRKKLAQARDGRNLVKTVRGEGYMLNPTLEKSRPKASAASA